MEGKFTNPLGANNQVWITQTYHSNSSNKAIDLYGAVYKANLPCYAIADGTITTATSSGNSYCVLTTSNGWKIFYVHTWHWLPVGTKVKSGDKICEVAPKTVNGGFPEHLHIGLGKIDSVFPNIMDYFDRDIPFRTKYSDIRASWFNGDTIDWNKFSNKYYMEVLVGKNLVMLDDMNVRDSNFNVIGTAKKSSVCYVISQYKVYQNVQFYLVKFSDQECYIGDTNFNEITVSPVTNLDGSKPLDEITVLKNKISQLELIVVAYERDLEILRTQKEEWSKEREELLRIKEQVKTFSISLNELQSSK